MEGVAHENPPPTGGRFRWLLAYSVDGDVRFISHHDTLRLFQRALARAQLPVRFSEGFNPHPKMMIPLPRPVGIASQAEVLVVETDRPIDPDDALLQLRRQAPQGIVLHSIRALGSGERMQPVAARYALELEQRPDAELLARIEDLKAAESLPVERTDHATRRTRKVDVRPFIVELVAKDEAIEFLVRTSGDGSVKPAEIAGLLGFDAQAINHRIRRMEVQWQ